MLPVQPRTMVEQAAESIVAAAARGFFLPGDRLVEAEIARDLGISRVPVREALRLLESQGIVTSTPYKGMRLMQVSNAGVAALMRVRLALETLAVREAMSRPRRDRFAPLRQAADAFTLAAGQADPAARVAAEEQFHGALCAASDNAPLLALWQSLSRQLAVVWGLGQTVTEPHRADREHHALVTAMDAGDEPGAVAILAAHVGHNEQHDLESVVAERRRA